MKSQTVILAGMEFKTQAALKRHIHEILYGTPLGQKVADEHHRSMVELLGRHPDDKIQAGVESFTVRKHTVYQTTGFAFTRVDGSVDDFSIDYCVRNYTPQEIAKRSFARAARHAVMPAVRRFRDQALRDAPVCALTGVPLTKETLHVDHAPPNTFKAIAAAYLADADMSPIDFEYACDNEGHCVFADSYFEDSFVVFHNHVAQLRLLAAKVNLSGGDWSA